MPSSIAVPAWGDSETRSNLVPGHKKSADTGGFRINLTETRKGSKMPLLAGQFFSSRQRERENEGDDDMGLVQMMERPQPADPLLTAEDVAERLNVTKDWVWDHSSRRVPYLPVIRMSDGALRYRASQIEEFLTERERASRLHRKRR